MQATDLAIDPSDGVAEVELPIAFLQTRSLGRQFRGLFDSGLFIAACEGFDSQHGRLDPELAQACFECIGRLVGLNGCFALLENRSCIELGGHVDDADAGLGVTCQDGPLDGRGTTVARQQGPVEIDSAEAGRSERFFR